MICVKELKIIIIELHFEKDALHSGYKECKRLRRRKPGFFNPFNKNFLSYEYQECVEHYSWIADCIMLRGEHPLIPSEVWTRNMEIASFKELTRDMKWFRYVSRCKKWLWCYDTSIELIK